MICITTATSTSALAPWDTRLLFINLHTLFEDEWKGARKTCSRRARGVIMMWFSERRLGSQAEMEYVFYLRVYITSSHFSRRGSPSFHPSWKKTHWNQRAVLTHNKVYLVVCKCFLFSSSIIWLYSYRSRQKPNFVSCPLNLFLLSSALAEGMPRAFPAWPWPDKWAAAGVWFSVSSLCIGAQMQVEIHL